MTTLRMFGTATLAALILSASIALPAAAATSDYNAVASARGSIFLGVGMTKMARLKLGERVVVTKCTLDKLWCFVERVGFDGWVSATSLRPLTARAGSPIDSRGRWLGPSSACTTTSGATMCITPQVTH